MRNPILSFNAGQLSPLIDARSDVNKYGAGCRILENMIPRIYGPAERRPGTRYLVNAYDTAVKSRLIPFEYSDTIAYMCEFSDRRIRFFFGNTVIQASGADLTIASPYLEADLFDIQFVQLNDVMWLTHPDYAPRKLTRTSAKSFTLTEISFTRGPFLPRNDLEVEDGVTLTPSVQTGTGTLTASSSMFTAGHVGALFKLSHPRVNVVASGSRTATGVINSLNVEGPYHFNTHGTWTATVALERQSDGTNWDTVRTIVGNADRNVQFAANEDDELVPYRINVTAYTSGTINADITVDTPLQDGICRIDSIVSGTVANMTVLTAFASTDATLRWYEGAWSEANGYPASVTFFEDRAIYAGTTAQPQTIWLSATGDYENFKTPITNTASSSFSLTIASEKRNAIRCINGDLDDLVFGTVGGIWRLWGSSEGTALSALQVNNAKKQDDHGINNVQMIAVGKVLLAVDTVGRKVREVAWNEDDQKYIAPDLSALAENITETGITSMAYQKNPDDIVWFTLTDGTLLSMTYERDQDVIAWSKHPVGGTNGTVESVAVIPGTSEDEVWISTSRTVNGSTTRFIEKMQPRDWGSDQADCWFVDAGILYDYSTTTTTSSSSTTSTTSSSTTSTTTSTTSTTTSSSTSSSSSSSSSTTTTASTSTSSSSTSTSTSSSSTSTSTSTSSSTASTASTSSSTSSTSSTASTTSSTSSTSSTASTSSTSTSTSSSTSSSSSSSTTAPGWTSSSSTSTSTSTSSSSSSTSTSSSTTTTATGTQTITGLSHLEGEEVVILAEGAVMEPQTVSGGSIELPYNVDKAIVGLAYTYKLKPMRFDAQIDDTTKGTVKNIGEIVLSFYKSGNVQYGPDTNNLRTIDWRTTEAYGTPPALFTGDKVVSFEGGFDPEDSILITGSGPLPCTLRAMVLRTDVTGR